MLHLLANIFNEETILTKVDALTKNVRKYDKTLTKKLELLNKALKEDKIILLRMPQAYINKDGKVISEVLNVWCRVYQIKEYRNKPFAILLPISKSGLICKPIEDLPIPLDVDSGRLLDEDPEKNRDLDKTFQKNNPQFSVWNPTIEKFLESAKKPSLNGWLLIATIYYKYKVRESVCYSFTEYFNAELPYNRCTLEAIKKFNRQKNIYIDDDPKGDYCYSMITIDSHSFKSWLMSEFSESSELTVGEVVGVLEPIYVKKLLARRYQTLAKRYESFLKVSDEVGSK